MRLPPITPHVQATLEDFERLAQEVNRRHNLYSEVSTREFWQRHILHSFALASRSFPAGSRVIDWGTGGGIPGIPLAILFPDVHFVLVDAVGKKIRAVEMMTRRMHLANVEAWYGRAETWPGETDYSVSRATAPLHTLWAWHRRTASTSTAKSSEEVWGTGLLCLKGGDLRGEVAALQSAYPEVIVNMQPLGPLLKEPYFEQKSLVHVSTSL